MSKPTDSQFMKFNSKIVDVKQTPTTVEWNIVMFAKDNDRTGQGIDIEQAFTPFFRDETLANKLLTNNNHNRKSYFPRMTDGVYDIKPVRDAENRLIEVTARVVSTNPDKVNNPGQVLGFSPEFRVTKNNVARFPDGTTYAREPELIGLSYLTDMEKRLAGSGNTRINSVNLYSLELDEAIIFDDDVNQLNYYMSPNTTPNLDKEADYAKEEEKSEDKDNKGDMAMMMQMIKAIQGKVFDMGTTVDKMCDKICAPEEDKKEPMPTDPEGTKKDGETKEYSTPVEDEIDQALTKAEQLASIMMNFQTKELVTDHLGAEKTANAKVPAHMKLKLQVADNLKNVR